jgi:prepilin-type processing-associated H-X9-DG protein
MRSLGQGFHLFASDNKDRIPYFYVMRDAEGFVAQQTWHAAIAPYVLRDLQNIFSIYDPGFDERNKRFLCPSAGDSTDFSYAMNREAQPGFEWSDTSAGDARTIGGKRISFFDAPGRLILLAEQGVPNGNEGSVGPREARWEAGSIRHRGRANYLFLDGSVRLLAPRDVYDPSATPPVNLWIRSSQ